MILVILFYLLVIILLLSYKPKPRKPGGRWRSENQYSPYSPIRETKNQYSPIGETKNQYSPIRETENQDSSIGETKNLLYSMCGGDQDLANRLAAFESAETEELRWKKAIYRLERDRS